MRKLRHKKSPGEQTQASFKTKYCRDDSKENKMKLQDDTTTQKPLTQCDKVLDCLSKNGSINPIQALSWFGCFSLAQRICDLRKRGHSIITKMVTKQGRYGKVTFAEYHLDNKAVSNG